MEPEAAAPAATTRNRWASGVGGAGHLVALLFAVLIGIALVTVLVEEATWGFTTIVPSRICADAQTGACMHRSPARVVAADGSSFWVTYDDAHRAKKLELVGNAPPVGSHVVLERWKGRLVSVVDSDERRRHTTQWPNREKDLLEALASFAGLLVAAGAAAGMLLLGRPTKITEPRVQT